MQDLEALDGKSLAELREIARALGIENIMVKKRELIAKIASGTAEAEAPTGPAAEEQAPRKRGRRPRTAVSEVVNDEREAVHRRLK